MLLQTCQDTARMLILDSSPQNYDEDEQVTKLQGLHSLGIENPSIQVFLVIFIRLLEIRMMRWPSASSKSVKQFIGLQ